MWRRTDQSRPCLARRSPSGGVPDRSWRTLALKVGPATILATALAIVIAPGGLLAPHPAGAILERSGEHILDAGAFRLFMTNLGVIGNPTYPSFSDHPSLEWPAGTGHEYLLEAGLWIGAEDRVGNLIGVSTSVPVNEFRPSLDEIDRIYRSFEESLARVTPGCVVP